MTDIEENVEYDNEDEYDVNDIIVEGNDDQNMIDILKKYNKHKKNYKTTRLFEMISHLKTSMLEL